MLIDANSELHCVILHVVCVQSLFLCIEWHSVALLVVPLEASQLLLLLALLPLLLLLLQSQQLWLVVPTERDTSKHELSTSYESLPQWELYALI